MKSQPDDSAFPLALVRDRDGSPSHPGAFHGDVCGLTKREHFAAVLMAGYGSNPANNARSIGDDAQLAVEAADALIAALNAESLNPAPSTEPLAECQHDWKPTGNGTDHKCSKCGEVTPF